MARVTGRAELSWSEMERDWEKGEARDSYTSEWRVRVWSLGGRSPASQSPLKSHRCQQDRLHPPRSSHTHLPLKRVLEPLLAAKLEEQRPPLMLPQFLPLSVFGLCEMHTHMFVQSVGTFLCQMLAQCRDAETHGHRAARVELPALCSHRHGGSQPMGTFP